jgi:hypothetical protein
MDGRLPSLSFALQFILGHHAAAIGTHADVQLQSAQQLIEVQTGAQLLAARFGMGVQMPT